MTNSDSPVSWGVLSTAKIGLDRVIGPMQQGRLTRIEAIASRDSGKAQEAARALGIPRSYGSYEDLLADPAIEAVYIPLPNHLHVEWAERAAAAGKHVLVEKPLGMTAGQAGRLIAARDRSRRLIIEAFMVRYAPQWQNVREVIASGRIGAVHGFQAHVTYRNMDAANIRNRPEVGGGALMDIGCYAILFARLAFGAEPRRAIGLIDRDPAMGTDRHASAILEFPNGQATLFCSTQLARAQRVRIFGTGGSIEIEVPVNAPDDRPTRIVVDDGRDVLASGAEVIEFPACNQYTLQGDAVSKMIRNGAAPEMTLEDSIANMRVLDAVFASERGGGWQPV
ncbi:MAG: Oxidoreductase, Gfo/Idh/MocA family [uncultured Microvirga sp.]|uniref:Oxidoreductase, Gfo/Idh/MocA family n=1 Tax=uncultured Microvirga sp. TaxID=412392 RepID=A0A6J4KVL0_9HYPH|nr:MAG: Oxidoreductase, Gfo/Idh/MocA family [uncultured Microvirga sp.]